MALSRFIMTQAGGDSHRINWRVRYCTAAAAREAVPVCEARMAYGLPALLPAKKEFFRGNNLTMRLADTLA